MPKRDEVSAVVFLSSVVTLAVIGVLAVVYWFLSDLFAAVFRALPH